MSSDDCWERCQWAVACPHFPGCKTPPKPRPSIVDEPLSAKNPYLRMSRTVPEVVKDKAKRRAVSARNQSTGQRDPVHHPQKGADGHLLRWRPATGGQQVE